MQDTYQTMLTVMLVLGGLCNLVLALCLAHTWRYWRQVKWYVIMLLVGNWVQVFFTFAMNLGISIRQTMIGPEASCKFLMFMTTLGPSLAAMALGALSVHVLITAISGCQGNRLRHALVLGLFVLLSLPVPLSQIPLSELHHLPHFDGTERKICVSNLYGGGREYYTAGMTAATVYFPIFIFLVCVIAAAILVAMKGRANTKGDENSSDVVFLGLLGVVQMLCCIPYGTFLIVEQFSHDSPDFYVTAGLMALTYSRNFISATVTVIFAYVHAFRNRGEGSITSGGDKHYGGERQKLVN